MSQAGRLGLGAAQDVETLTPDAGDVVGPNGSGNINVVGGTYTTTTGVAATNTVTWDVAGLLATLTGSSGGAAVSGDGSDNIDLIAGTNMTITGNPGANTITFDAVGGGGGITWNEVTGTSASMVVNNGYIANNAGLVTLTIPTTAAVGDSVRVTGKGAGGWRIAQNASEIIHFGIVSTTTGVGGRLDSTQQRDGVELVCVVADTEWNVISSIGNIDVT